MKRSQLPQELEHHFTSKYGSWLNMAEWERSAMTSQYITKKRRSILETVQGEGSTWSQVRNYKQKRIDRQLTTENLRIKLKRLYPIIKE